MKEIKSKIIFFAICAAISVCLIVLSCVKIIDAAPIGTAMLVVCVVRLILYARISRNDALLSKHNARAHEERLTMIADKSGRFTYEAMFLLLLLAIIIGTITGQAVLVSFAVVFIAAQVIINLIVYAVLSRRY